MSSHRADGTTTGADIALPYRAPYDWAALHGFLAARAIPGIETAEPGVYARTIAIDGRHGSFDVRASEEGWALTATIRIEDSRAIPGIAERLRRLFDCDADPQGIGGRLRA
ncbi:AlkA N-terminal domain-containing protein, partial [Methylobacterium haplocladii]